MSRVLAALTRFAGDTPQSVALEALSDTESLSYAELSDAVDRLSAILRQVGVRVLAILADNTPAWAVADLAAIRAELSVVPIPHFFSPSQIHHLLQSSGVDAILSDRADQAAALLAGLNISCAGTMEVPAGKQILSMFSLDAGSAGLGSSQSTPLPESCAKLTYTSGSTGEPKGVCLSLKAMETVAESLAEATRAEASERHLSGLPYATLLENIGGLYTPLLVGATVCVPGLAAVGLSGASGLDVKQFVTVLNERQITTTIMIPQMLHGLVAAVEAGMPRPQSLRYIAVGGAPVSEHLLHRAEQLGLPVFEGYGLSEAASVVAVNRPGKVKHGSVGKPLSHVELAFAEDGEIQVRGSLFSGYLGDDPLPDGAYWPTGDIGYLDDEDFLHLSGRKKHLFITAFGRNVSPEWVERELNIEPVIAQVCVFGEARPFNVAVIFARENLHTEGVSEAIQKAVDAANNRLPDYARVTHWLLADQPFTTANGLWTGTGRPRREHIYSAYENEIEHIYEEHA